MHTHTQQTAGGSPPACSDSPEFQISTGRRPCRALEGAPFSADWHCRRSQALVLRFEFHPSATAPPAAGGRAALAKDGTRGEIMVTKKLVLANRPFSRASFQYLLSLTTSRSLLATRCLSSDAIQVPTAGFLSLDTLQWLALQAGLGSVNGGCWTSRSACAPATSVVHGGTPPPLLFPMSAPTPHFTSHPTLQASRGPTAEPRRSVEAEGAHGAANTPGVEPGLWNLCPSPPWRSDPGKPLPTDLSRRPNQLSKMGCGGAR